MGKPVTDEGPVIREYVESESSDTINEDCDKPNDNDPVNHPDHYANSDIECWDAMLAAFGPEIMAHYCLVVMFKYNWRALAKNGLEDIRKNQWYTSRLIELAEKYDIPGFKKEK